MENTRVQSSTQNHHKSTIPCRLFLSRLLNRTGEMSICSIIYVQTYLIIKNNELFFLKKYVQDGSIKTIINQ